MSSLNKYLFMQLICIGCIFIFTISSAEQVLSETSTNTDDFEIKSLSGEPNYRSVNLTWEIEDEKIKHDDEHDDDDDDDGNETIEEDDENDDSEEEDEDDNEIKRNFVVYYCEMQTWGPHRCKSKYLSDNDIVDDGSENKQYSMTIDNLRMATKYSFHVRKQKNKRGEKKMKGRSDNTSENDFETNEIPLGESIIIPTKGFSAQATKCLAHASEIEVETGPYFAGRISTEGGNCHIQGDGKDPRETYTMKIDHDSCGSKVNHGNLTVETFITVQENLGIFTHSTRRFVVLCTYQPETLTVRASFAVPGGKGGVAAIPMADWHESGRNARERHFRLVDKSALVLKENDPDSEIPKNNSEELNDNDKLGTLQEIPSTRKRESRMEIGDDEENIINDEQYKIKLKSTKDVHFARLVDDRQIADNENLINLINENSDNNNKNQYNNSDSSSTGIIIIVSLSVIMSCAFVYVMQREYKKQRNIKMIRSMEVVNAQQA